MNRPQTAQFTVTKSDDDWKKILSPAAYNVLRKHGTERPYSSDLNSNKKSGVYQCAACDYELFDSNDKFESGTGWPSYTRPIRPAAVGTSEDKSFFSTRTEVHCNNCGGHQGHVFKDGPQPTGLRYCINGVALKFKERV